MESSSYTYTRLGDLSIRLLTLLPNNNKQAEIHCQIVEANLAHNLSYEALFYTWGNPNDKSPNLIYLNGQPVKISRNLETALQALRSTEPRILWVDALCINQADNNEKSRQVAMMDVIYKRAKSTIVWLGDEDSDSNIAMSSLASMKSKKDLEKLSNAQNQAIGNLFSRPWFSRVWVVQEFGLAKRVVFCCGQMPFSWDCIEKNIEWADLQELST